MTTATLLAVAHGTRDPAGIATLGRLVAGIATRRPALAVRLAYLEVAAPGVADALADVAGPVVVVPLLLASGYHDRADLRHTVAAGRPDAVVAAVLGPDPLLAAALRARLTEAGWRRTGRGGREAIGRDGIVLAAAGSSDGRATASVAAQARILGNAAGVPVVAGYLSAAEPTVPAAVRQLRSGGADRVAIASYLLAPGHFQTTLTGSLAAAGVDVVTEPLGAHPAVVSLALGRYDDAARSLANRSRRAAG